MSRQSLQVLEKDSVAAACICQGVAGNPGFCFFFCHCLGRQVGTSVGVTDEWTARVCRPRVSLRGISGASYKGAKFSAVVVCVLQQELLESFQWSGDSTDIHKQPEF